jgi:hypothetical protein
MPKKVLTSLDLENTARLLNLPEPIETDEAATKNYVDDLAATMSVLNKFRYVDSTLGYYNLISDDLGYLIEVDTTDGDVDIRLPNSFVVGWWCSLVKESNNNVITFSSVLPIKAKGNTLDISRSPAFLTYTDQGYWRIIGELVNL